MTRKIAMIGGGSYSWAYGLYSTFLDNAFFGRETELCLYDINEKALNDVYSYITYYNDRNPEKAITVTKTMNEDEALEGAKFVVGRLGLAAQICVQGSGVISEANENVPIYFNYFKPYTGQLRIEGNALFAS